MHNLLDNCHGGENLFYPKAIVNQTMAMNNPWSLSLGVASDIKFFITFKNTLSDKSVEGFYRQGV